MPTTVGPQIRTVADIVQTVLKCSKENATAAELEICKSPTNIARLAVACGISVAAVGAGGRLIVGGAATGGSMVIPGIAIGAAGLLGAKRFCRSMVDRATSKAGSPGTE